MRLKPFLPLVFLLCSAATTAQLYSSLNFSTDKGLPDAFVYHSFQDSEGFLWSSTTKGLSKFDGQFFKTYSISSDGSDFIYSGACDKNGKHWFGSFSGKLYTYDVKRDKLTRLKDSITGSVDKILVSSYGTNIYFVSKGNGINVFNGTQLKPIPFSQIYQVNNALEWSEGILLLATPEGLYFVNVNTGLFRKINGGDGDVLGIQALDKKAKSLLVSLAGKGFMQAGLTGGLDSVVFTNYAPLDFFDGKDLGAFHVDMGAGLAYVALRDESFHIADFSDRSVKSFSGDEFSAMANHLEQDRDNNIWVSTAGKGLYRFYRQDYHFITVNNESVYSIAKGPKGRLFCATASGIAWQEGDKQQWNYLSKIAGRNTGKINALYYDGKKLWAGGDEKALFVLDPLTLNGEYLPFSEINNISINSISGNYTEGEVFVNTNLDGVFIFSDYKIKHHFSVKNSLLHNNVYYSFGHKKKVYYATHNTAINFSEGDKVYEIEMRDKGLVSDFNCFAGDSLGNMAIGTNGDGVYFLNDTNISPMLSNNQLESRYINSLCYDKEGNLWIALRYSIYKYYPGKKILKKLNLLADENRLFNQNAFYADNDGFIFFGSSKNIVKVKSTENKTSLPKSYVTGVFVSDSLFPLTETFELENGQFTVRFVYSALCLKNSEEVYYRFILEGRDAHWSEPTSLRQAEFAGLGEGEYVFKIQAYNSDGLSGGEAVIRFVINPPIWKSPWFWLAAFVVLAAIMYFIVRVRTAALVKAKVRLEILVDEKTIELRREKEMVEAKNVIIEEQNQEIKSSITYAKRIQEAILPDARAYQELEDQLLILYKPKDIVSGDFYWIAEKNGRMLMAACDCTGHGVPGAFMSMIGSTLLNKIIFDKQVDDPGSVMREMDLEVSQSLHQENNEVNDGMEAGLCSIDLKKREILYAGAKRPLFLYRKTESGFVLEEFKADKFPIGGFAEIKDKVFKTNIIKAQKGDMLYMFSDGIIDQFNDGQNKRIGTKQVRAMLENMASLPIKEQKEQVNSFIESWRGKTIQTDDILLLGIRL